MDKFQKSENTEPDYKLGETFSEKLVRNISLEKPSQWKYSKDIPQEMLTLFEGGFFNPDLMLRQGGFFNPDLMLRQGGFAYGIKEIIELHGNDIEETRAKALVFAQGFLNGVSIMARAIPKKGILSTGSYDPTKIQEFCDYGFYLIEAIINATLDHHSASQGGQEGEKEVNTVKAKVLSLVPPPPKKS